MTPKEYSNPISETIPLADDHRAAETFNYKPADPRRLAFLISVARGEVSREQAEQEAQIVKTLSRIAAGKGGPVELPKVQQSEGNKFIAQLSARIHELKHRYGFQIENRTTEDGGQKLSFYWLVLDESGGPKMSPVRMAEVKTGKPKAATSSTPASKPKTGWRSPENGFSYSPNHSPVRVPPTLPAASPKPSQPVQSCMFDTTKSAVSL